MQVLQYSGSLVFAVRRSQKRRKCRASHTPCTRKRLSHFSSLFFCWRVVSDRKRGLACVSWACEKRRGKILTINTRPKSTAVGKGSVGGSCIRPYGCNKQNVARKEKESERQRRERLAAAGRASFRNFACSELRLMRRACDLISLSLLSSKTALQSSISFSPIRPLFPSCCCFMLQHHSNPTAADAGIAVKIEKETENRRECSEREMRRRRSG